jgi:glutamate-1-semialdehyde 2,1-aminomutase
VASSEEWFARARLRMPGGVNSPVRAFRAVGGTPPFVARARGAWLEDVDGRRYVDLCMSWGPLPLGHAPPEVVEAVCRAAADGTSFGAPHAGEVELAEMIAAAMPAVEMVRLCSSGTEAVMSAVRLARAYTGRCKLVKFAGCYHGHADAMLVQAGSGALTAGVPSSPGVPPAVAADTLVCRYNDLGSVEEVCRAHPGQIAAIIVEPVAGNMGLVLPRAGFLQGLRRLADASGALLIFDEVITGFRVAYGGAQGLYGIRPDLTCLGKVIGGGLPVGAYGGRAEVMRLIAPEGPVYQAGTLSGNPLAVAAGLATLRRLAVPGTYAELERVGARAAAILRREAARAGVPCSVVQLGSVVTAFFCAQEPADLEGALQADTAAYARFHRAMLQRGVYLPPAQYECCFLSLAHGEEELARLEAAAREAFAAVRDGRGG